MKAAVLGASGAMASVVIRDLLELGGDVEITAADLRPRDWADPRVRPSALDVRDLEATSRLLEGHDVVLNCVTYYFNVEVMRAALQARVPYADLGGLYHGSVRQFALHEEFLHAGVTAVLGMGSTPGITNVMAGALADGLDAVEAAHVRIGTVDGTATGTLPVPYALDTILDEFSLQPMVLHEGRELAVEPMSGEEEIEFPPPVGRVVAFHTLHSEVAMFPRSFPGLREASFKIAFEPDFVRKLRFLVELGFASKDKLAGGLSPREMLIALAERQPTPEGEPADCDVLRVEVTGMRGGVKVGRMAESVIHPHPAWGMPAGSLDTGVPLSIVGGMLMRREISTPGVLCPETCVPREAFFVELAKRGIEIRFHPEWRVR